MFQLTHSARTPTLQAIVLLVIKAIKYKMENALSLNLMMPTVRPHQVNNVVNVTKVISIVKPTEFVRELTHFVGHLTKPLELVLVAILAMRLTMLMATVRFPSRTLTARTSKPTTHADCAQPVTS